VKTPYEEKKGRKKKKRVISKKNPEAPTEVDHTASDSIVFQPPDIF